MMWRPVNESSEAQGFESLGIAHATTLCVVAVVIGVSIAAASAAAGAQRAHKAIDAKGGTLGAAGAKGAQQAPPDPFVHLYDTRAPLPAPLGGAALTKRSGWSAVPEDNTSHKFAGDAVLANDKLAVILRAGAAGAKLYARDAAGAWTPRGELGVRLTAEAATPAPGLPAAATPAPPATISAVSIVENTPGAVMLAATFGAKAGPRGGPAGSNAGGKAAAAPAAATVHFRLTTGLPIVECQAGAGASAIEIRDDIRYVVVPELLASDCVLDPSAMTGPRTGIPAENILMTLLADGQALGVCTWKSNERNADALSQRQSSASAPAEGAWKLRACRIECRPGESVWYAVLAAPGVWHGQAVTGGDVGRTMALKWRPPFAAKWRCGLAYARGLAMSYDVADRAPPAGAATAPSAGMSGVLPSPCWLTPAGVSVRVGPVWPAPGGGSATQPAATQPTRQQGDVPQALAIYPLDRAVGTGMVYCPIDVMRETLGLGACQYLLDVLGLSGREDQTVQEVAKWMRGVFERKQEARQADEIRRRMAGAARIALAKEASEKAYGDVFVRIHRLCQSARGSGDPEVALAAACIDGYVAENAEVVLKFAEKPEFRGVTARTIPLLTEAILRNIGKGDALEAVRRRTEVLHWVGEYPDYVLAGLRMEMRVIRERCRDLAGSHPRAAEFLGKVRAEAQAMLRSKPPAPAGEGDGR